MPAAPPSMPPSPRVESTSQSPAAPSRPRLSAPGEGARAPKRLRDLLRLWRLYWLGLQLRLVPTEPQRLFALTMGIGVVCGLAAVAFHLSIEGLGRVLIERSLAAPGAAGAFWTIATPTLGGAVCGALLTYAVPNARGSGIPQVKAAFALNEGRLRFRDSVGKFVIGSLQIGSGASLGREGPTVQICAGLASLLGRAAKVSPRSLRRLLPVGAAAGIAAAFNAPIAAVTFTVEEVVGALDRSVLSGVIVAAALAAVIERSVLGEHPVFEIPKGYGLSHASSLAIYALLGLAAGLVSVAFTDSLLTLRRWFRGQRAIPAWAQPGVGGAITGALAVVALRWLRSGGVTGGGYPTLAHALAGELPVWVMLALCAMKVVATVASYGSGGAGGIFAPSLFIGGMLGGAFGALDVRLFGHADDAIGAFALVGMGAAFSGIVRAPLTSVLIIIEMTSGYSLILPLMIANMSSYVLARALRPTPVYEALLEQDGIELHDRALAEELEGVPLSEVVTRDAPFVSFRPTSTARELARSRGAQEVFPVVDPSGGVVGLVTDEELKLLADEPTLDALVNAADVMRPPVALGLHDDLHAALSVMLRHRLPQLPVIAEDGGVAGLVDEATIARAYLRWRKAHGD